MWEGSRFDQLPYPSQPGAEGLEEDLFRSSADEIADADTHASNSTISLDDDGRAISTNAIQLGCVSVEISDIRKSEKYSSSRATNSNLVDAYDSVPTSRHLEFARRQGKLRLRRLRWPTLFLGPLCVFGGAFLAIRGISPALEEVGWFFSQLGITILLLSLLPADTWRVHLALLLVAIPISMILCFFFAARCSSIIRRWKSDDCHLDDNGEYVYCSCVVIALEFSIAAKDVIFHFINCCFFVKWLCSRISSQLLLQRAWRVLSVVFFMAALSSSGNSLVWICVSRMTPALRPLMRVFLNLFFLVVIVRYDVIVQFQSWLMSRGEAAAAAAGVAELLGGEEPKYVLFRARQTFQYVRLRKLTYEGFLENKPNPALASIACKASLEHVDAFVSHSWHDDPSLKWAALGSWCNAFKIEHSGREPTLWIDKYCIDQDNIEGSLACLPVYLSGCKKLLVLCGHTYLTRLWCLVEIFVFLEMGGTRENLEVCFLEPPFRQSDSISKALQFFDSRNACCSTEEDTLRLRRVLEISGCTKVNRLVKDVFQDVFASMQEDARGAHNI